MKIKPLQSLLVMLVFLPFPWSSFPAEAPTRPLSFQAPVLKWQLGGCYSSWCEMGWYSSPAVADLDGDGSPEVIGSAYSIVVLDGATGSLKWQVKSGHDISEGTQVDNVGRTWAGIVVADVEADGQLEIVSAHSGGYVSVYDQAGNFEPGWPQHPATNEFRSLAVGDLDQDSSMEIAVGLARLDHTNIWVFEPNGTLRAGWPQLSTDQGSAAGLYNDNIGMGDLDGDGSLEVSVPSDTITICTYKPDGSQLMTNPIYHDQPGHDMDYWGEVPAYVDLQYEIRGWGPCYDEPTARANFANGPANIVDVNGDGINEVVAIGNVHDCNTSPYTDLYNVPYILNADRSRFKADGFDWTTLPANTGAPLSENYNIIESVQPNPVTVDLDGDGNLEILYPSYDGRMHAFWLDKSEHGNWPYQVYNPAEGFLRFASEPVVADLDRDGHAEVIFASWTQKGSNHSGKLHILDYQGNPIYEVDLPPAYGSPDWNGSLAAPTLANIDGDPDLEVVLNTAHSGLVAYDLPGTAEARLLWSTGRGSLLRNGLVTGNLSTAESHVDRFIANPGDTLTYTIDLQNSGTPLSDVSVSDVLPAGVHYEGVASLSSGDLTYDSANSTIHWSLSIATGAHESFSFHATIDDQLSGFQVLANKVQIDDGLGNLLERQAITTLNGKQVYLPMLERGH